MKGKIKYIYIANSALFVDGHLVLTGENSIFVKFLKEVYKYTGVKYSKYFKMDALSKLGFLASEVLMQNAEHDYEAHRCGVVLENKVSTFLVDKKHQESISDKENYFPSPANFVYTLPNVMTGEICIRQGFKGENAVFINKEFDAAFIMNYLKVLYAADKVDMMIAGFVDADEDHYEAFMFYADRENIENIDAQVLEELYQNSKEKSLENNNKL